MSFHPTSTTPLDNALNILRDQELIANMLAVRREGVTEAAGKLQKVKKATDRLATLSLSPSPPLAPSQLRASGRLQR